VTAAPSAAPSRSGRLRLAALVAFLASSAATPVPLAASATTTQVAGPSCDQIRGTVLGQTHRWRIVLVGNGLSQPVPLVACHRGLPGPAAVRVLGMSKQFDGEGEDSDAPTGGPYVSLEQFQGSRAVLLTRTFSDWIGDSTGAISLVDLDRGASEVVFDHYADHVSVPISGASLETRMTPAGGLALASVEWHGTARVQSTAWQLWDADGVRAWPEATTTVEPSIGVGGDTGGMYYRDHARNAGRALLHGPAKLSGTPPDPALTWRSMRLPRLRPYTGGFQGEPIVDPAATVFPTDYFVGGPFLEFSTSSADPNATVRVVADAGGSGLLATLAPHSLAQFKVLTASGGGAIATGRFAGRPDQRRVRALGAPKAAVAFFDVAPRRAMSRPGQATMGSGAWALADGHTLRFWHGRRGSRRPIPGVHDLALTDGPNVGLFYTDGSGRAHYTVR